MSEEQLTPLKVKVKKYRIVAFDSEDDSNGNVTLFNFYDGKSHFTFDLLNGKTIQDVIKFCYVYVPRNALFVAHNLEYDLNNMLRDVDYMPIDKMIYTSKLMTATFQDANLKFIDSMNFFAGKLSKMGEIVGIKKGDYQQARVTQKENIEYCKTDCEILWSFVSQLQDKVNEEFNVCLAPTIGKMAMDCFRANYLHKKYDRFNHPICRDGYYGGRVEVFYKGMVEGDVVVSDVNSMYPYVMLNQFPDTNTMEEGLSIDQAEFGIGRFKIFIPDMKVPPLPYRAPSGRLYFPTGEITGTWTYHEVRNALKHGCKIIQEYECFGTNHGDRVFANYINDIYDKRLIAKAEGNEFLITFFKLFMNTLYGKWSQNNDSREMTVKPYDQRSLMKRGGILDRVIGNFHLYTFPAHEPPKTANWIWGTYITSYARIYLHNLLVDTDKAGHQLLYCDTDSVIFKKNSDNIPFPLGKKLGELDYEEFDSGDFKNPKAYILKKGEKVKIACKGVPTNYALKFFQEGHAEFMKPVKLRESLVQSLRANVWQETEKTMRTIYIKRKGTGETKSINVNEIEEQEKYLKKHLAFSHKNL